MLLLLVTSREVNRVIFSRIFVYLNTFHRRFVLLSPFYHYCDTDFHNDHVLSYFDLNHLH